MTFGRWVVGAAVALLMLLAGCGGGSGRSGTDLYVSGVGPAAKVNGGDAVAFVMTVTNGGPYSADNVVVRNSVLQVSQAALVMSCTSTGGATCPGTPGQTMSVGSMPAGSSLVFQINSVANTGASGLVGNTMSVSSDSTDINGDNNSVSVTAAVASNDVTVTGTAPPGPVLSGPATFTMVVTNTGPDEATNVTLATSVSAGLSFQPADVNCVASAGALAPTLQSDGTLLTRSIPLNGVLTCSIPVFVGVGSGGFALVSMTATSVGDSRNSNDSATATVTLSATNDVAVTGTAPPGPVLSGPATFTMVVTNIGPDVATNVTLATSVSAGLSFQPADVNCVASVGALAPTLQSDGTLLAPSIPLNGVLTCSIPVVVGVGSGGFALVSMTATSAGDSRTSNNSATASVGASATNDVAVTGTAPPGPVLSGLATFTMVVTNAGPDVATNVTLATSVSAGLTFQPADVRCAASAGALAPTLQSDGTLRTTSIPLNGVLTCSIPVVVGVGSGGFALVSMTATSAGDSRTSNNSATATVAVSATNDVAVTGTAPPGPLVNSTANFKMMVSNAGPDKASNVSLTTTSSSNLTFSPADIACAASGGASSAVPQTDGTLLVASLPSGGSLSCNVPVTLVAGTTGLASVTMSAASVGDTRSANNSATAAVSTNLSNNITVSGTALSTQVIGGQATTFTFTVVNNGPSTAYDVALSNVLGSGLSLSGAIACVPSLGASTPVAVTGGFTVASMPLNGTVTCTLPLVVAAGANGTVSTTFTATAAGDTNPYDNSARVSTVAVSSDLGASQTGTAQLAAGKTSTFVALVSNPGPGTASNVKINWSFSAPSGATVSVPTCVGSAGATCPSNLGPAMTLASLAQGRTLQFTFNVTTDSSTRGTIINTVSVASDEDQNLANNTALASTQVVDGRTGTYTVFAADGRQYSMAIDFDALQYTISGNGSSSTQAFAANGSGDYVVSGNARLRTGDDIIIGSHDFAGNGTSALPYFAARNFINQVSQLGGSYNLATLNVDSAGNTTTRPGTALISGNTLTVCQSDSVEVQQVRNCAAASRKDYLNLTLSGNVITGYIPSTGEQYSFSVATSGGAKILLGAGLVNGGTQQLRIGLIDSTAGYTYGPGLRGPSNTGSGDWASATLTLGNTNPIFASTGATGPSDSVNLVDISTTGSGPFSMLEGTSQIYGATVYVMQAYPLVVVVGGAPVYAGASSGFLQLGLP